MNANESREFMIKDWHVFQHYKKGNKNYSDEMKWFKLYGRKLMQDKAFMTLDPNARDTLNMLWIIASQRDGILPSISDIAFASRKDESDISEHVRLFLDNDIFIQEYNEHTHNKYYEREDVLDIETGEYLPGFPKSSTYQVTILDAMDNLDRNKWLQEAETGYSMALCDDKKTKMNIDDTLTFCKAYKRAKNIS
jgi:hypothetical protein